MVGRIGASAGLDMSPETRTFSSAIVCEGQPRDERVYWLAGVRQKDHQLYRKKEAAGQRDGKGDGGGWSEELKRRGEGRKDAGRLGRN